MHSSDRRTSERRGISHSPAINLGAALADERRERRDRRDHPRRRADMRTIAHYARRIGAGHTRLEVIVDGTEGLRLVAMFQCGCVAIEPVGTGPATVRTETCAEHTDPVVTVDRRRGSR
ncbi:MAG: hypothetical protein ABSH03_13575 [Candidatus Lustribacter sp.]|jgi:hypothetical protein